MKIHLVFIFAVMLFAFGVQVYAQDLTVDDLIEKIKSVVDMDLDQEDRLKPILGDYVDSINKINDLIQKGMDQQTIDQRLSIINDALDLKLKDIFTPDQLHQWNVEKRVVYKEILIPADG